MKSDEFFDTIAKVKLIRELIKSKFFDDKQITQVCIWLGIGDAFFWEDSSLDKLKSEYLSEEYWFKHFAGLN